MSIYRPSENVDRCPTCGMLVSLSEGWHHRSSCRAREQVVGSMVEAMARAIALEEGTGADWHSYVLTARAALEAMRSPTVAMIGAGAIAGACANDAAAAVWGAMVEAAGR